MPDVKARREGEGEEEEERGLHRVQYLGRGVACTPRTLFLPVYRAPRTSSCSLLSTIRCFAISARSAAITFELLQCVK